MNAKLEERKKAIESEFEKLNKERETLVGQRKELDQKLSQVQVRQVQLQGAYATVEDLLKDSDEAKPEERKE